MRPDYKKRSKLAGYTGHWAPIITKQTISRSLQGKWPKWKFRDFYGKHGRESRGIVDIIAIRKDHRLPRIGGTKRGDLFQIVLIQVKGGTAPKPKPDDLTRLRAVASYYHAQDIILAAWKKGRESQFYSLGRTQTWKRITDLNEVFS